MCFNKTCVSTKHVGSMLISVMLAALPSKGRVFMYCNDYSTWRDIEHGLRRRRHGVTDMGPFRAQKL